MKEPGCNNVTNKIKKLILKHARTAEDLKTSNYGTNKRGYKFHFSFPIHIIISLVYHMFFFFFLSSLTAFQFPGKCSKSWHKTGFCISSVDQLFHYQTTKFRQPCYLSTFCTPVFLDSCVKIFAFFLLCCQISVTYFPIILPLVTFQLVIYCHNVLTIQFLSQTVPTIQQSMRVPTFHLCHCFPTIQILSPCSNHSATVIVFQFLPQFKTTTHCFHFNTARYIFMNTHTNCNLDKRVFFQQYKPS